MPGNIDRLTRVNELLKREMAEYLEKDFNAPAGVLISVTEVKVSVDLRNATVMISVFGGKPVDRRKIFEELDVERPAIQHKIARELKFKRTPVLAFKHDRRMEAADRVLEILGETPPNDEES